MKPRKAKPAPNTRCLGPGEEHRFFSPDPTKIRICPECTKLRQPPINVLQEQFDSGSRVERHQSRAT